MLQSKNRKIFFQAGSFSDKQSWFQKTLRKEAINIQR